MLSWIWFWNVPTLDNDMYFDQTFLQSCILGLILFYFILVLVYFGIKDIFDLLKLVLGRLKLFLKLEVGESKPGWGSYFRFHKDGIERLHLLLELTVFTL